MASSGHVAFYPAFAQIEGRGASISTTASGSILLNFLFNKIFKIKSGLGKSSELDLFNEIFKIKSGRGKSLERRQRWQD